MKKISALWITSIIAIISLLIFGNVRNVFGWQVGFASYGMTFFIMGVLFPNESRKKNKHYFIVVSAIVANTLILYQESKDFYFPIPVLGFILNALMFYYAGRLLVIRNLYLSAFTSLLILLFNYKFCDWLPSYFYKAHSNQQEFSQIIDKKPVLTFTNLNGQVITDTTWKNKVIIIDFWFLECGWCHKKIPLLEQLSQHYERSKDVQVISVIDGSINKIEDVREYVKSHKMIIPIYYDKNGDFIRRYKLGSRGFPVEIKVDKKGIVRNVLLGIWSFEESYVEESIKYINEFI